MESYEKNISSTPTSVLFIPKLPPVLASWNTLKTHFSQFGDVRSVVVNPQHRSAVVSFESTSDAEYAKSKGCVWKNKEFQVEFSNDGYVCSNPKTKSVSVLGYSELETLWSDDDIEQFGVAKVKTPAHKVKDYRNKIDNVAIQIKDRSASKAAIRKVKLREIVIPNSRAVSDKKSPKSPKLKSSIEKKSPTSKTSIDRKTRSLTLLYSKEKRKEVKKKVEEALLELKKKRLRGSKQSLDTDTVTMKSVDKSVLSLKEKFEILEEKDKLIRKSLVKSSDVKTAKAVIGTCPDMCPEKERIMREYRRLVSVYEMKPGTQEMDHNIAVKAYVRSSADQEEPLPHELRPEPVLSMTMSYLITRIMPLINDPDVNISDWYDFCWDRLRGIRKDVIQQRLCSLETVAIIEQCARFHICCYDYFWGADPSIFDEKINTENLINCLQTLRHMYEDLAKEDINCPNEGEFNAYLILLNLKTGDLMAAYQLFSENLQKHDSIQTVVKLYLAFNNAMYSQFFKLVKNSTYLDTCLLQRYFYHVRVQALQAIARAYCPPNKSGTIPLKQLKNTLKFDSAEDTEMFCEGHGIMLKENGRDFSLYRNDFFLPSTKIKSFVSSSLVTRKRVPLIEAVTGGCYRLSDLENHRIHSSFPDDEIEKMAYDSSDQKNKFFKEDFPVIDSEMVEELTNPDDQMEDRQFSFVDRTYKDSVDGAEKHEVEVKDPMETDAYIEEFTEVLEKEVNPSPKIKNSETELKNIENNVFDNNELVSRKHDNDFSAFKFELKPVIESKKEPAFQDSGPFQFRLTTDTYGIQNQLQTSKTNPLPFKSNLSHPLEDSEQSDTLNSDKRFENSKSYLGSSEHPFNLNVNKSGNSAITTVSSFNQPFVFSLGTKYSENNTSNVDKHTGVNVKPNIKDSLASDMGLERTKGYADTCQKVKRSYEWNKKKEQLGKEIRENLNSSSLEVVEGLEKVSSDSSVDLDQEDNARKLHDFLEKEKTAEIKRKLREKEALDHLKKDLRRRLKTITARHFIRKWKRKIEKIKENREDFPLLISTPVDRHESVWGSVVNEKFLSSRTLFNWLNEKQQNLRKAKLILNKGLDNSVRYMGSEIAKNIVSNNSLKLELRDFSVPYYWKLVVSIPFSEDSFFTKKFHDWLNKLFYTSEDLLLGSVAKEKTPQNITVYYCVHIVTGIDFNNQKDKINGMNGLIFFNISGIENPVEKCKRFRNLVSSNKGTKPVTMALVTVGDVADNDNSQLVNCLNSRLKRGKLKNLIEEYWSDFNSIDRVIKFLTSDVDLTNCIRASTLYSLLNRISEHLLSVLDSTKIISEEFSNAVLNPNFVIGFYNLFFEKLEKLITDNDFRDYDIVPPEFKDSVHYLSKPGKDLAFDINFSKSRRLNIVKAFSKIKLPLIKPWPPQTASELLDTLDAYCDSIGCNSILPRLIRMIDFNDDLDVHQNLSNVSWINIVDLIVRWLLETNSDNNNSIVVIYNENYLLDLCQIDVSFKILYNSSLNF